MRNNLAKIFLIYLRLFAKIQLKKIKPIIIGIGGASGKSSLSLLTAQILNKKYKIKESKEKNSETGIPLNILDISLDNYSYTSWLKVAFLAPIKLITNWEKYDVFIVEMGIDGPNPPKNMEYLLGIVKPNIAVLTNISIEHSLYFDHLIEEADEQLRKSELLNLITKQEKLLLTRIDKSGRTIINLDDENINKITSIKSKTLTVSKVKKDADFYISRTTVSENSFTVNFKFLDENYTINIKQPLPDYFAYTILNAIALAFSVGIGLRESIKILENDFELPAGRFSVFKGIKNSMIIDSSYNSSLEPAIGALDVVSKIASNRRRVGIIGDMRELGIISKIQHEALAREIVKKLDSVVIIGEEVGKFVAPILQKNDFNYKHFNTFKEGKMFINDMIKRNDLVLVKASQNNLFLERAVEMLLTNKSDIELLPRRGKYWNKIRQKTP